MSRRVLKDVAFGLVLQFFILILQFLAALIAVPLGWAPYESAPEDPANAPGWLAAISAMMLIASPGVLLLTGALAQLLRVRTPHDGDARRELGRGDRSSAYRDFSAAAVN